MMVGGDDGAHDYDLSRPVDAADHHIDQAIIDVNPHLLKIVVHPDDSVSQSFGDESIVEKLSHNFDADEHRDNIAKPASDVKTIHDTLDDVIAQIEKITVVGSESIDNVVVPEPVLFGSSRDDSNVNLVVVPPHVDQTSAGITVECTHDHVAFHHEVFSDTMKVDKDQRESAQETAEAAQNTVNTAVDEVYTEVVNDTGEFFNDTKNVASGTTEVIKNTIEVDRDPKEVVQHTIEVDSGVVEAMVNGTAKIPEQITEVVEGTTSIDNEEKEFANITREVLQSTGEVVKDLTEVSQNTQGFANITSEALKNSGEIEKDSTNVLQNTEEFVNVTTEVLQNTAQVVKDCTEVFQNTEELAKVATGDQNSAKDSIDIVEDTAEVVRNNAEVVKDTTKVVRSITTDTEVVTDSTEAVSPAMVSFHNDITIMNNDHDHVVRRSRSDVNLETPRSLTPRRRRFPPVASPDGSIRRMFTTAEHHRKRRHRKLRELEKSATNRVPLQFVGRSKRVEPVRPAELAQRQLLMRPSTAERYVMTFKIYQPSSGIRFRRADPVPFELKGVALRRGGT